MKTLPEDRWAPHIAPNKAESRRRVVRTIVENFEQKQKLYAVSLCGLTPYTEHMLLNYNLDIEFDLVERDTETYKKIQDILDNEFKNVGDMSDLYKVELRQFLENSIKKYDIALLDLMGGWCQSYMDIFKSSVNTLSEDGIIFFTYSPKWRFMDYDLAHYPEDLERIYNLKKLWDHDYGDSKVQMRTSAFARSRRAPSGKPTPCAYGGYSYYNKSDYQRYQDEGWRCLKQILQDCPQEYTADQIRSLGRHVNKVLPKLENIRGIFNTPGGSVSGVFYAPNAIPEVKKYLATKGYEFDTSVTPVAQEEEVLDLVVVETSCAEPTSQIPVSHPNIAQQFADVAIGILRDVVNNKDQLRLIPEIVELIQKM
jgi:hypothetical protein